MEGNRLKIWIIFFHNEIAPEEVPAFRGAVIANSGSESLLFHNHESDERLRYRYPLIQYKRINRKAAIVCVGEGVEKFGAFFANCSFDVLIGSRCVTLQVERTNAYRHLLQLWDTMFIYRIRKWLPLNQVNYAKYMALESLAEKYAMLEKLLTGNILSMAKGLGIRFEKQVECKIVAMEEPCLITYKGVKMMAFDAKFKSNVSLPDYIGLGKGVSLGMGTVVRKYEKKNEDNNE